MKVNNRVVIYSIGPNHGRIGTVVGKSHIFTRARFTVLVDETGELIHTNAIRKARRNELKLQHRTQPLPRDHRDAA